MPTKQPMLCSRALAFTLDAISKNQLIDLVCSLSREQLEFKPSDKKILMWVQTKIDPVWAFREDRRIALDHRYQGFLRASEYHRREDGHG